MATISQALNTMFQPTKTVFILQVTGGEVVVERRGTSTAAWAPLVMGPAGVGSSGLQNRYIVDGAVTVDNPVAGAQYQIVAVSGNPVVQVDE